MTIAPAAQPKILLVDDEPLILSMAAEVLEDAGFAVTASGSAEQALALVEHGYRPEMLVTDDIMQAISGTDLALRLRRDIGLSAILIVSGNGVPEHTSFATLAKPYQLDELIAAVRAQLITPDSTL